MKIAINQCYGGFSLSAAGFKHYLDLKGIKYGTCKTQWQWREDDEDFYHDGHVGESDHYLSDRDIPRDDPALIQTIEELGAKTQLQVYLAEKIFQCLWWLRRYETQKRSTIVAGMADALTHYATPKELKLQVQHLINASDWNIFNNLRSYL